MNDSDVVLEVLKFVLDGGKKNTLFTFRPLQIKLYELKLGDSLASGTLLCEAMDRLINSGLEQLIEQGIISPSKREGRYSYSGDTSLLEAESNFLGEESAQEFKKNPFPPYI